MSITTVTLLKMVGDSQGMKEKHIEQQLAREVKKRGGLCEKWTAGTSGWPDRIILMGGSVAFVEVKAPGKEPRPLQAHRHRQLRKLGYKVFVLDDPGQIKNIIDEIGGDAR